MLFRKAGVSRMRERMRKANLLDFSPSATHFLLSSCFPEENFPGSSPHPLRLCADQGPSSSAARAMAAKPVGSRLAPPTRRPWIEGTAMRALALSALTDPP